eukprot:24372_1
MSNASLDGSLMIMISGNDAKRMIKEQMLQFMTQKTLDIMFKCFDVFKEKYPHKIKSKSAADIAAIIYRYPIQNVIRRIQDENITGEQFEDIRDIIEQETGWKKSEIYQIESILLKLISNTKSPMSQVPLTPLFPTPPQNGYNNDHLPPLRPTPIKFINDNSYSNSN